MSKRREWLCFHCGQLFTSVASAAEHFGSTQEEIPACKMSSADFHLVRYVRALHRELAAYRREDNHVLRAMDSMKAEHSEQLRKEEEKGFARGVANMREHGYRIE